MLSWHVREYAFQMMAAERLARLLEELSGQGKIKEAVETLEESSAKTSTHRDDTPG